MIKVNIPTSAELVITIGIDQDKWLELERKGYQQAFIEQNIKQALTSLNTDQINKESAPIISVDDVSIRKFY